MEDQSGGDEEQGASEGAGAARSSRASLCGSVPTAPAIGMTWDYATARGRRAREKGTFAAQARYPSLEERTRSVLPALPSFGCRLPKSGRCATVASSLSTGQALAAAASSSLRARQQPERFASASSRRCNIIRGSVVVKNMIRSDVRLTANEGKHHRSDNAGHWVRIERADLR